MFYIYPITDIDIGIYCAQSFTDRVTSLWQHTSFKHVTVTWHIHCLRCLLMCHNVYPPWHFYLLYSI